MAPFLIPLALAAAAGLAIVRRTETRNLLRDPLYWVIAAAIILPGGVYTATHGIHIEAARLLLEPKHYFAWAALLHKSFDLWLVFLSLWGVLLFPERWRWLPFSLLGRISPAGYTPAGRCGIRTQFEPRVDPG